VQVVEFLQMGQDDVPFPLIDLPELEVLADMLEYQVAGKVEAAPHISHSPPAAGQDRTHLLLRLQLGYDKCKDALDIDPHIKYVI